jgi:ribonuclease HI
MNQYFLSWFDIQNKEKRYHLNTKRNGQIELISTHKNNFSFLRWIKPQQPLLKLNTDASYSYNTHSSFGGILRDHKGNMIFSYYGPIKANTPLLAEFFAMLIGLRLCAKFQIQTNAIILESDNKTLVEAINNVSCPIWNYLPFWKELTSFCRHMHTIKYTSRETNALADALAKQGKFVPSINVKFSIYELNKLCRNIIRLDQMDVPYMRIGTNN